MKDDLLVFNDDNNSSKEENINKCPWKILIVDDDEDIHSLTKMVLSDYKFENRGLEIYSTYSGKEAIDFLKREKHIALILLDVVMESDDAGLKCVKAIREDLKNDLTRIILRTGQPGQAPEHEVIIDYDINDYKAKTELTSAKLFTTVTASLRSYKHITTINKNKMGLENIITASSSLFEVKSFSLFAKGILKQLTSILSLDESSLYINCSSLSAFKDKKTSNYSILACTGEFAGHEREPVDSVVSEDVHKKLMDAATKCESIFTPNTYTGYFKTKKSESTLLYLQWQRPLTQIDRDLISIFSTNVSVAFENLSLSNEMVQTQKEVIFSLSEIVEGKSLETSNHIHRVADVACMLGKKVGLNEHQLDIIKMAAPMHDIGKVGTPDSILKKPGKLTAEEFETMKEHATLGYNVFKGSTSEVMKSAAIIAHQHHEKWNGDGYPQGLVGEETHIFARLVGLSDVVDALMHRRCYKEPWSLESVISFLSEQRGEHFDPDLVDAFLNSIDEYRKILNQYS